MKLDPTPFVAAAAALLIVAGLSGCVAEGPLAGSSADPSDEETPEDAHEHHEGTVVRIQAGAADPDGDGTGYHPGRVSAVVGEPITLVNEDDASHRLLGALDPAEHRPAWVDPLAAGGGGHDHGGHDHGGHGNGGDGDEASGAGDSVLDITVAPGGEERIEFADVGRYRIHCHPHPWMETNWTVAPEGVDDYPVVVNRVDLTGSAGVSLDTSHAPGSNVSWTVTGANLRWINVTATWDDADDDGAAGEPANHPDRVRVELRDPDDRVVASDTQTARQGSIELSIHPDGRSWPDAIEARNRSAAYSGLLDQHPPQLEATGNWTVDVVLEQAPGPIPGVNGSHDVPETDGKQDVTVSVEAVHAWGDVVWPDASAEPEQLAGEIHLDAGDHEH